MDLEDLPDSVLEGILENSSSSSRLVSKRWRGLINESIRTFRCNKEKLTKAIKAFPNATTAILQGKDILYLNEFPAHSNKELQNLKKLKKLKVLIFNNINIDLQTCEMLTEFKQLRALVINDLFCSNEIVSLLSKITSLRSLKISLCRHFDVKLLKNLVNLEYIDLHGSVIGPMGARAISSLTNLTTLNLQGNYIGDQGAQSLAALTNLTDLNLSRNCIGDVGIEAIATALTKLKKLDLTFNRKRNMDISPFKSCTDLSHLELCKHFVVDMRETSIRVGLLKSCVP